MQPGDGGPRPGAKARAARDRKPRAAGPLGPGSMARTHPLRGTARCGSHPLASPALPPSISRVLVRACRAATRLSPGRARVLRSRRGCSRIERQRLGMSAVPGQRRALAEQAMPHRQHVAGDAGVLVAATRPATRLARTGEAARAVQKQGWVGLPLDPTTTALHRAGGEGALENAIGADGMEMSHGVRSFPGFLNTAPALQPGPGRKGAPAPARGGARPAQRLAQPPPLRPGPGCGRPRFLRFGLPLASASALPGALWVQKEHAPRSAGSPIHNGVVAIDAGGARRGSVIRGTPGVAGRLRDPGPRHAPSHVARCSPG